MPTGQGSVPWQVIVVIVVLVLIAFSPMQGVVLLVGLGGLGAWLIYSAVKGLRQRGSVSYWRGQRITLDSPAEREHVLRSVASIVVGLAFIGAAVWYLLLR